MQQKLSNSHRITNNVNIETGPQRLDGPREQTSYNASAFPQPAFIGIPASAGDVSADHTSLGLSQVQTEPQVWIGDLMQDSSPTTYIPNLTSWGDLDSLALTGLGELGYLFSSDNLQGFEN
jgi:galactonate dehydratase